MTASAIGYGNFSTRSSSRLMDIERTILGAIGGGLVAVIAYPLPAYETFFVSEDITFYLIGWFIRLIGLGFLGGLWAYLHKNENDRMKTFQLGIVGPAIISAMISANAQQIQQNAQQGSFLKLIPPAYAQSAGGSTQVPTTREQIIEGLLGTQRP